jgi:hypothetical protein
MCEDPTLVWPFYAGAFLCSKGPLMYKNPTLPPALSLLQGILCIKGHVCERAYLR